MRLEAGDFDEVELELLVLARRLRDALRIEELLTEAGFDYFLETGEYSGGLLFKRSLTGVYIYVTAESLPAARQLLRQNQFKPYDADHPQ